MLLEKGISKLSSFYYCKVNEQKILLKINSLTNCTKKTVVCLIVITFGIICTDNVMTLGKIETDNINHNYNNTQANEVNTDKCELRLVNLNQFDHTNQLKKLYLITFSDNHCTKKYLILYLKSEL